ncbi:MAG: serine hydrolase [bacterium]|nr:serine hydrolase [bacterium]
MKGCTVFFALCSLFLFSTFVYPQPAIQAKSEPAAPFQWRTTSPEQQGMDSAKLADLLGHIRQQDYHFHSLIIARNGTLLSETYFHPFPADGRNTIHSCSKSILSALVGIALDKGLLKSLDAPVLSFFTGKTVQNRDKRKEAMTLRHLLTMSAGLGTRDSYKYRFEGMRQLWASSDWEQFILDISMVAAPGERFEYSNSVSYLLASILQKSSGTNVLTLARQHLFRPLGITENDVTWHKNSFGKVLGWGGVNIKPRDMVKFGQLYLQKGKWNGRQIVPAAWVEVSTRSQIQAGTLSDNYGYHWWIDDGGYFMALGYGAQYIIMVPSKQLVVVFTSALAGGRFYTPPALLRQYILPAVKSGTPLKENEKAFARLQAEQKRAAAPVPAKVPPLPSMALRISGKRYLLETNVGHITEFTLTFEKGKAEAHMHFVGPSGGHTMPVGLDGLYRTKTLAGQNRASRGHWEADGVFATQQQTVGVTRRERVTFTFSGETVRISIHQLFGGADVELKGRQAPTP